MPGTRKRKINDGASTSQTNGNNNSAKRPKLAAETTSIQVLLNKVTSDLTPAELRHVRDYEKWLIVGELVDEEMLRRQQPCITIGADCYAGCGHPCCAGEVHWACHKCRAMAKTTPCCRTLADKCPSGSKMTTSAYIARNNLMKSWLEKISKGIYPTFNGPVGAEVVAAKLAEQPGAQPPHPTMIRLVEDYIQARDPPKKSTKSAKKRKSDGLCPTNVIPSQIDAKNHNNIDLDLFEQMQEYGFKPVNLKPAKPDDCGRGLPLRPEIVKALDNCLGEAKKQWLQHDQNVMVFPQLDAMKLDRAPYELTDMNITLQPLQFPAVETPGVRLTALSAQSKVATSQTELAYMEQAIKLSIHAVSNSMDYSDFSKVKMREAQQPDQDEAERPDTENGTIADLNTAITDTQLDALRGLVVSLAIVIVARRRAVIAPLNTMTKEEYVTLLTQPITDMTTLV